MLRNKAEGSKRRSKGTTGRRRAVRGPGAQLLLLLSEVPRGLGRELEMYF